MVLTLGNGIVNGFTLDTALGDFILTHPNIRVPERGQIYSINEGNTAVWDDQIRSYVNSKKYPAEG